MYDDTLHILLIKLSYEKLPNGHLFLVFKVRFHDSQIRQEYSFHYTDDFEAPRELIDAYSLQNRLAPPHHFWLLFNLHAPEHSPPPGHM